MGMAFVMTTVWTHVPGRWICAVCATAPVPFTRVDVLKSPPVIAIVQVTSPMKMAIVRII
jgi:hypothetical protein